MQAIIFGFVGLGRRGVPFVAGADACLISEGLLLLFEKVLKRERHLGNTLAAYTSGVSILRIRLHT